MNRLKVIGIVLIVAAPLVGIVLQARWRLLATQRPAETTGMSSMTLPDGTVV